MGLLDLVPLGLVRLLQQVGIGASKKRMIIINNSDSRTVINSLKRLSLEQKWPMEKEYEEDGHHKIVFQIGQWGLNISGSQKLFVDILIIGNGISVSLESKSTMGQLVDWGANKKNLDTVESYLKNYFQVRIQNE